MVLSLLSILGIVISFVMFRLSVKEVQLEHFKETLQSSANHKLMDTNNILNEMVEDLESVAKIINKYDDFWHPEVKKILQVSNEISWFNFTSIADAEGNGYDNAGNEFNIADREYFQTAMKGQVAFSDVVKSKIFKGEYVQIIAHPLRSEEHEVRGVVFGVMNIHDMKNMNIYKDYGDSDKIYIIDSCGTYIGRFHENNLGGSHINFWSDLEKSTINDKEISKIKSDFEERKEGEFSYSYEGEKRYACYMPIGPNKWQLVYSVSDNSMDELVHSLYKLDTRNTIWGSVCYLLLVLCIIWYFEQANDKIRKAHQEAKRNMGYMRIAIEHSKNIVFEYNQKSRVIQLKTDTRNRLFDRSVITSVPESFVSMNIIDPDSIPTFEKLFETIKTEGNSEAEIQIISDHEEIWYRISMNNIYNDRNEILDTIGIIEDISSLKKSEVAMRRKLQVYDTLIANAIVYAKVDLSTDMLLELNGEEVQIPFRDFICRMIREKVSEEYASYVEEKLSLESLNKAYQEGKESIEIEFVMKLDNIFKWVSCVVYRIYKDDSSTVIFVITDINDRKCKEIALKEQAERDGLTGLYNASTTRLKINEILSLKHSLTEYQIFILIDLDNYKLINDTFGHSYGDQVLIDIATILNTRFRSSDIIGRLGGDEFIVLLCNVKSYDCIEFMIQELCKKIHKTYREGDKEVTISASIGVAIAPSDGNTFEELYKKSDIAQYQIKKEGKNGYKRYQKQRV